ncbi:hypothetical protein DHEL01_v212939 [Diaporthe helianthi]|uniref:Uncharacterized protein n=1 Tax=Diaporthe helianthi TaxID=158607 RepID=A0A2P5HEK7_DIAHE|nr:hypothetical protein DHEL01_v212939 [Diaporthe helianthi]
MDYNRPSPNYELDQEWWWPSYKFTLPLDDLFDSLYTQYNTVTIPIQDPEAFHHDVYETCTVATTASEFHKLLAERRELRLQELRTSWGAVASRIAARPRLIVPAPASKLEAADVWADFMYFSREFSFDALVKFVSSLTGHSEHTPELVSTAQPPASTAQKRALSRDEHDYTRSKKRRVSEDLDEENSGTSEEDSPAADFASAQRCTPPSSVPSPATKAISTPDSAESIANLPALHYTQTQVLRPTSKVVTTPEPAETTADLATLDHAQTTTFQLAPEPHSQKCTARAAKSTITRQRRSSRIRHRTAAQAISASCQFRTASAP